MYVALIVIVNANSCSVNKQSMMWIILCLNTMLVVILVFPYVLDLVEQNYFSF